MTVANNVGGPRDPEELEATTSAASAEISAQTTLGAVHLTVSDLERSVLYYRKTVGLEVLEKGVGRATIGVAGQTLLVLVEEAGATPSLGRTGLYHFALLVPLRVDLARWLAHAARDQVALAGVADHFVSEALYLTDPDHHGIEIYWDRPREVWVGKVTARMGTASLDVRGLLDELEAPESEPFSGLPPGTSMGHLHLKAAEIMNTIEFYRGLLGFGLMARLGDQAAFLSAGGYHHHIGANTWESAGASPPLRGSAALRHGTIILPDNAERDRVFDRLGPSALSAKETADGPMVYDPSQNALVLAIPSR